IEEAIGWRGGIDCHQQLAAGNDFVDRLCNGCRRNKGGSSDGDPRQRTQNSTHVLLPELCCASRTCRAWRDTTAVRPLTTVLIEPRMTGSFLRGRLSASYADILL